MSSLSIFLVLLCFLLSPALCGGIDEYNQLKNLVNVNRNLCNHCAKLNSYGIDFSKIKFNNNKLYLKNATYLDVGTCMSYPTEKKDLNDPEQNLTKKIQTIQRANAVLYNCQAEGKKYHFTKEIKQMFQLALIEGISFKPKGQKTNELNFEFSINQKENYKKLDIFAKKLMTQFTPIITIDLLTNQPIFPPLDLLHTEDPIGLHGYMLHFDGLLEKKKNLFIEKVSVRANMKGRLFGYILDLSGRVKQKFEGNFDTKGKFLWNTITLEPSTRINENYQVVVGYEGKAMFVRRKVDTALNGLVKRSTEILFENRYVDRNEYERVIFKKSRNPNHKFRTIRSNNNIDMRVVISNL